MQALCKCLEHNKKVRISCDHYASNFLITFGFCKKCLKRIIFLLRKGLTYYEYNDSPPSKESFPLI